MSFDGSTIGTATTATFTSFVFSDTFSIANTGDVDMVAVTLAAGTRYVFDIDNGTAGDLYLRVFDAFGTEVRANDDGFRTTDDVVFSLSPYLELTPNYSGTYYVAVSTYHLQSYDPFTTFGRSPPVENPIGIVSGTVSMTADAFTTWPGVGSINGITTEGTSDVTDSFRDENRSHRVNFSGSIDFLEDIDLARIDLFKGDVVVVDVNGLSGFASLLRVFNSSGTQIGIDDFSGTGSDAELVFGAPSAGSHYIGISGDGNGGYNVIDGTGTLPGSTGNFEIIVHLNPTLVGTNSLQLISGGLDNDYIVGLAGNDTLLGNEGDDTIAGGDDQDSLSGGRGRDVIYGENGNDTLLGDEGTDVLSGGLGNDTLNGGSGNDLLEGGAQNDVLNGGKGNSADTLRGDAGDDTLFGDKGNDSLLGGDGNDSLTGGDNNDLLNGGAGIDTLLGGYGDDVAFGESGSDSILGGAGNDLLNGGLDDDTLSGGNNLDTLIGGAGFDSLIGGTGNDVFQFLSVADGFDTIADLQLGFDLIDLSDIFASTGAVVTAANLAQFIQVTPSGLGADSFLGVDANGVTGGLSFSIIAQVNAVTTVQLFDVDNFIL